MKKIISLFTFFTVVLGLASSAMSQEKRIEVEKVNSGMFSIKQMNLLEQPDIFQLQYSIFNKAKTNSTGLQVVLTGYDKSGKLLARQIRRDFLVSLTPRFSSILDVSSLLKGAFRYTVDFSSPGQVTSLDDGGTGCSSCTDDAIRACNGQVSSVDCTSKPDGTIGCSYKCKEPPPID